MTMSQARLSAGAGLATLFVLALPPMRTWLEASMVAHMLIQIPLLATTGFAAGFGLSPSQRARLRRLIGGPLPFVLTALLASSYWMLPRALDATLVNPFAELAKFASLPLLVGLPLALGWERLEAVGRGFVWTNFFSMLAVVGWLYIAAPVRVCNSYLVADQYDAGLWMVRLAIALFLAWLASLFMHRAPAYTTLRATLASTITQARPAP
ncbi:MAG TPA: hypothetical protein VIQ28_00460 [Burkholderiales bacterium]